MRTEFIGGGLIPETVESPLMATPSEWMVPEYVDFRPYVLPASNQGRIPACAGYATAGYAEVLNWRMHDSYDQVDGVKIYQEAKTFDGIAGDGTTLSAAVKAAKNLTLLPENYNVRIVKTKSQLQYAMHRYGVVIGAFFISDGWNSTDSQGYIQEGNTTGLGGHAVLINYYDQKGIGWQNSWGNEWGDEGWGFMSWSEWEREFIHAAVIERD